MPYKAFQTIAGFAIRHERALTIAGAIWLAVSCAAYARFLELPRIPFVTDQYAFWLSGAWNAVWWGFLHPGIQRKKLELEFQRQSEETHPG